MAIRIDKVYIKNFKVYKEKTFDFSQGELVVFDGPNGFGKTTIYDALELVFTGTIRRYAKLMHLLVDQRETKYENPLFHDNHQDSEKDIIIKVSFKRNDQKHIWAIWNKTANHPGLYFDHYQLHKLETYTDIPSERNLASNELREEVLGTNFFNDFKFINYIEQEDTFSYLRSPEKDKRNGIDYLFNTKIFQSEIESLSQIESRLRELLDGDEGLSEKAQELRENISEIGNQLKPIDQTGYQKLFVEKNFDWDLPEIDFDLVTYDDLTNAIDGIFPSLEYLVTKRDNFTSYFTFKKIDQILNKEDLLENFFFYQHYLDSYEQLVAEREIHEEIDYFIDLFDDIDLDDFLSEEVELLRNVSSKSNSPELFQRFHSDLSTLRSLFKDSDSVTRIHSRISSSRNQLIEHLKNPEPLFKIDEGVCPLCGHNHNDLDTLLESIESQKEAMLELNFSIDKRLEDFKHDFLRFIEDSFVPVLEVMLEGLLYNPEYFEKEFFNKELILRFKPLQETFDKLQIDYKDQVNSNAERDLSAFEGFADYLKSLQNEYSEDAMLLHSTNVFKRFFNEDFEELDQISVDDLILKKSYVDWQYSLLQNEQLTDKKEALELNENKLKKLRDFHEELKSIINSMRQSLNWYNKELTKDIELLFHIYFGRIAQDFQGGIGLFIDNNEKKLKFTTTPDKSFDAIFSLSTGQLSALVLSFTLALNKKYSKSKLLFIDDPIQSMDDINVAGFVELLRNEFSDRHIFLSTHEMRMSTYLRYKFEKFNLTTQRIDLSSTIG